MVVVGNGGRSKRPRCALRLRGIALFRFAISAVDGGHPRARRPRRGPSATPCAPAAAARRSRDRRRHGLVVPPSRALPMTASSPIFCTAKASQLFRSGSRSVSVFEIDRHMQQRAGRRDLNVIRAAFGDDRLSRSRIAGRSARQMLRPSITPSDRTRPRGALREHFIQLFGRAHQIDVQAGDRQRQRPFRDCRRARRNRSRA